MADIIKLVFKRFSQSNRNPISTSIGLYDAAPRPDAVELSCLGRLPSELLLQISTHLQEYEIALLALVCRKFYLLLQGYILPPNQLSSAPWELIDLNRPQGYWDYWVVQEDERYYARKRKATIIALLQRDLPNSIACLDCNRLHSLPKTANNVFSQKAKASRPCWCMYTFSLKKTDHIYPGFSECIFRMAVKAHQQNNYEVSAALLHILTPRTWILPNPYGRKGVYPEQRKVSLRIINSSLFVRVQQRFLVPTDYPRTFPDQWYDRLAICPHRLRFDPSPSHLDIFSTSSQDIELQSCSRCHTEHLISQYPLGRKRKVVFVTKWLDLGDGRDMFAGKWISHIENNWRNPADVVYEPGSICASFEGTPYKDFHAEKLLSRKEKGQLIRCAKWRKWME